MYLLMTTYRVDATKTQRERLDSDLRFMVEKALNEAGIMHGKVIKRDATQEKKCL